jgi:hypothetical protein
MRKRPPEEIHLKKQVLTSFFLNLLYKCMSESSFRFRHFTIHQDKCAMKVGTDAVLLGSWVYPGAAKKFLTLAQEQASLL